MASRPNPRSASSPSPDDYLAKVVERLRPLAGPDLVGVYAAGSYALGAYEHGRSDLDVAAVIARPATRAFKQEVVAALRHESLPCPARGLELVLYSAEALRRPTTDAAFELNLNTGERMPFRADVEPDPSEAHWFVIDRSILAERGVALYGPPARDVFAPIPRAELLPVLAESLRRQAGAAHRLDDVVLNACRTWMYIEEGVWSSKPAAGVWAEARTPIAGQALRARHGEGELDSIAVRRFVECVVRAALHRQT